MYNINDVLRSGLRALIYSVFGKRGRLMKIICNGYDLSEAVNKVIKAVGAKTVSPILEGIKIETVDGGIKLTATDMELAIEKVIAAEVRAEGAVVVPGRLFAEFVKKIDAERVELSLFEDKKMKMRYRGCESEFNCLPEDEYPVIKKLDDAKYFTFLGKNLRDLINKVSFCVSTDESRPILKGVSLDLEGNTVTAVATDGYRLARCVKNVESSDGNMTAVVPARSLNEIARLIEDDEQPVTVALQKNYLAVDFQHTCVTSRLLEGSYINYRQIIPQRFETRATLAKDAFSASLERAILLTRSDRNNLVKFDMHENMMDITSDSEAGRVDEHLDIKLEGKDLTIAFNARYFTELIKYIGSDCMTISFNDAIQPCIVTPADSTEDLLYLILPVRMA